MQKTKIDILIEKEYEQGIIDGKLREAYKDGVVKGRELYKLTLKEKKEKMGLLKHHGKVEFVSKDSVHRMSLEEARAFLALSEAQIVLYEKNILALYAIMDVVKEVHGLRKRNQDGYYIHTVTHGKLGGE